MEKKKKNPARQLCKYTTREGIKEVKKEEEREEGRKHTDQHETGEELKFGDNLTQMNEANSS